LVSIFEGFTDGEGAAVFRQKRKMSIKGTAGRGGQIGAGDDFAVGNDQKKIRFEQFEVAEIGGVQFFRFEDGQVVFGSQLRNG